MKGYTNLSAVPRSRPTRCGNTRNDMYLASEALRTLPKIQDNALTPADGDHAQRPTRRDLDTLDQVHPAPG